MKDEKLVARIQKLLALAKSSNENEAQSAMLKAQMLLAKHGMELDEVEEVDFSIRETATEHTDFSVKTQWKISLLKVICDNFKCKYYACGAKGQEKAAILGLKEDAEICKEVLKFAYKAIESGADKCYTYYWDRKLPSKGVKGDYRIGFIKGLRKKFEAQKAANPGMALALVVPKEVSEEYDGLVFGGSKVSAMRTKIQGNQHARNMGYQDGLNFGHEKKLK